MRIYNNDSNTLDVVTNSTVFKNDIWNSDFSLFQGSSKGVYYRSNIKLINLIKCIVNKNLLPKDDLQLLDDVVNGIRKKEEMFGYVPTIFKTDVNGKTSRNNDNIEKYSRLVQLDLDIKNEVNHCPATILAIKEDLFLLLPQLAQHIAIMGNSISGKGLFAYILVDTEDIDVIEVVFKKFNTIISDFFKFKSEKTCDTSIKDAKTRFRYYSNDYDLIINDNVKPVNTSKISVNKINKTYTKKLCSNEEQTINIQFKKLLSDFTSNTIYKSGFDNCIFKFYTSCMFFGVSSETLLDWTIYNYKDLHKSGHGNYLGKLKTVLESAKKYNK